MPLLIGTLACLVAFATVTAAQTPAPIAAVERYVTAELARQRIPGLSVAILRGDRLVLARGYGYANLEHHVRATDSTVYQVGSVTKQFTAAAVVMLFEQGRLRLDDPITQYLPEGSSVWRGVTIRHLLTHTSGIPEFGDTLDWRRDYTEGELVRLAATQPLGFVPGASWSYGSIGYALLGVIVHRVSGVPWGDFLRDRVFRPLGMRSARVNSNTVIIPNRAAGYEFVNDTLRNQWWASPTLTSMADLGLSVSVRDLVRWAVGLDQGKVLSRSALEASWTPVRLASGASYPYGLGWHLTQQRGYRRIGHGGSWQGFWTTIQRYPEFDLTVVVLANLAQANPEAIAFGIAGLLEPALKAPHLLSTPLSGATPPQPIDRLVADIVAGRDSAKVTPGLRAVTPSARRERIGGWLEAFDDWTFLGCDAVADRRISRLGAPVHQICYSKGVAKKGGMLFAILYDPAWRATGIDLYFF
ncbi:MAG: serine hydrolase domain-containing protein [Gemmatimonadales bacterium]